MKKYYAVQVGKVPGIYFTWEECKNQVHGYPGAVYKSFRSSREAQAFLAAEKVFCPKGEAVRSQEEVCMRAPLKETIRLAAGEAVAYVDGSFQVSSQTYGCGVVLFLPDGTEEISERGGSPELSAMRNVAGELLGARRAMERCVELGIRKLTLYHDYQGIASWCLGEWKANKEGTKAYKAYFDSVRGKLEVCFCKVKGHSGDPYHDRADELARQAVS